MKKLMLIFIGIVAVVGLRTCFYTVDESEFAYVTRLGGHVATYDGSVRNDAGLHFGYPWPFETVVRIDRRIQHFDLPAVEQITKDSRLDGTIDQTVTVDGYVCWRIPNKEAVDRFIRSVGTTARAEQILLDRIRGDLGATIPTMSMEDLINPDAALVDAQREALRAKLMAPHQQATNAERSSLQEGLEVVDIRIRRINHPPEVRYAIYQRIISERERKAATYRAEGVSKAAAIRSDSDARIARLQATVSAELREKRGAAEAQAERIRSEAQRKDPEYYAELKRRQIALEGFKENTKVWSTRLWDLMFPFPNKMPQGGKP